MKDGKKTWGAEESDQFWVDMSKAFAAVSSGDVIVVLSAAPDEEPQLPVLSRGRREHNDPKC